MNGAANGSCTDACLTRFCGDGIIDANSEQCDDGGTQGGDGCSPNCQHEVCGNTIVDVAAGELCDLGTGVNSNSPNALCRTDCQPRRCGDGGHCHTHRARDR